MTGMRREPESQDPAVPLVSGESLDLTGLPTPIADELRKLVATLRDNLGPVPGFPRAVAAEAPDEWARRLQAWVDRHPPRAIRIDDSRESLYSGRGE